MNHHPQITGHAATLAGITDALTQRPGLLPQTQPMFLRDVLRMKRARGDADCDAFKLVAKDFEFGLSATIAGAARPMRRWIAERPDAVSDDHHARRIAFLADLDRVIAGDRRGWTAEAA